MRNDPTLDDDAANQAECVVRALDTYISILNEPNSGVSVREACRDVLVKTIAASIRMNEPRKSPLQAQ